MIDKLAQLGKSTVDEGDANWVLSIFGAHGRGSNGPKTPTALLKLSGVGFERIVTELLRGMGFQAEMTKASGDGGIDIEAVLERPLVGGRYLFQCKRYSNARLVGEQTIREFYGVVTRRSEVVKGVVVTTSSFTAAARKWAKDVRLELIDGRQLQELLQQNKSQ